MLDYKPNIVLSNKEYNVVGSRPIRHDGADKVTGRARYGADISLPGMLYGKILRSPPRPREDQVHRHQPRGGPSRSQGRCNLRRDGPTLQATSSTWPKAHWPTPAS